MATRTVLVAGASGLVGFAAARHFARLPDWKVIAVSRRLPEGLDGVELVSQRPSNEVVPLGARVSIRLHEGRVPVLT